MNRMHPAAGVSKKLQCGKTQREFRTEKDVNFGGRGFCTTFLQCSQYGKEECLQPPISLSMYTMHESYRLEKL